MTNQTTTAIPYFTSSMTAGIAYYDSSGNRMNISSTGNIGFGNINPSQKLDIRNSPLEEMKREFLDFLFDLKMLNSFPEVRNGFAYDCLNLVEDIMIIMEEKVVIDKIGSLYEMLDKTKINNESRAKLGHIIDKAIEKSWFIKSYDFEINSPFCEMDPEFQDS